MREVGAHGARVDERPSALDTACILGQDGYEQEAALKAEEAEVDRSWCAARGLCADVVGVVSPDARGGMGGTQQERVEAATTRTKDALKPSSPPSPLLTRTSLSLGPCGA